MKAEKAHLRASDIGTFRSLLTAKTGGVVAGWLALAGMDDRMGYQEFATVSRKLGFQGDTKAAWKELDKDGKGVVTLAEWAPEAAALILGCKELLRSKYGNVLKGWIAAIDVEKSISVGKEKFVAALNKLGFQGNAGRLFDILDVNGSGTVSLDELDPDAQDAMLRGDHDLEFDAEDDPTLSANARRAKAESRRQRKRIERSRASELRKNMGATNLLELRSQLVRTYGNVLCAWDALGGLRGKGMGAKEFMRAARAVGGYINEPKPLFADMGLKEGSIVYLEHLAPEAGKLLNSFIEWILDKCGSMHLAWAALDTEKVTFVSKAKFVARCETMGYAGDAAKVFATLDVNGSGTLTLDELDPKAARELVGSTDKTLDKQALKSAGLDKQVTRMKTSKTVAVPDASPTAPAP